MTGTQSEFDRIFDLCLERLQGGSEPLYAILADYPDYADELGPLLEASAWLIEGKSAFDPRPSFVAVSRKNLVSRIQAEVVLASDPVQEYAQKTFFAALWDRLTSPQRTQPQRLAFQLAFVLVMLIGMILGGTGLASWAGAAQPGDVLYPLKIAFEQLDLALVLDPGNDIRLHMEFARLRSDEMQSLVSSSQYTYLRDLLTNYRYHMDEAMRLLALLAEADPEAARNLAVEMYGIVLEEPRTFLGLAQSVPEQIFSGFSVALEEMAGRFDLMLGILDDLNIEIDPAPTPGGIRIPTRTPVPSQTSPPRGTSPSGSVPTPTTTPTPTMTASQTQTSTPISTPTSPPVWVPTSTATQRPGPPRSTNTPAPTPTATKNPPTPSATMPPPTATATSPPPPPTPTATMPPPPHTPTTTSPPPPHTPTPTDPPYPR